MVPMLDQQSWIIGVGWNLGMVSGISFIKVVIISILFICFYKNLHKSFVLAYLNFYFM